MSVTELVALISAAGALVVSSLALFPQWRKARADAKAVDVAEKSATVISVKTEAEAAKVEAEVEDIVAARRLEELNRLYPQIREMSEEILGLRKDVREASRRADEAERSARESREAAEAALDEVRRYRETNEELLDVAIDNHDKLRALRNLVQQIVHRSNITMTHEEQQTFDQTEPRPIPPALRAKIRRASARRATS
jgi:uncharacterized protein YoxC